MLMNFYVWYDDVAKECTDYFSAPNDGVAVRNTAIVVSQRHFIKDMSLWLVGTFDTSRLDGFTPSQPVKVDVATAYKYPEVKSKDISGSTDPNKVVDDFNKAISDLQNK